MELGNSLEKNPEVDLYMEDGCGRCSFYKTDKCKVKKWVKELDTLRSIVLKTGLKEDLKWKQPCYTSNGKNIVLVSAFKEYCALSFFKGALLNDTENILITQTENSQANRQLRFTDFKQILQQEEIIKAYIVEAVKIEESGAKVEFKKNSVDIPEELHNIFEKDSNFKDAFYSLTPGRQRGYILFFTSAKQSKTVISRIEKNRENIMAGKGLNE